MSTNEVPTSANQILIMARLKKLTDAVERSTAEIRVWNNIHDRSKDAGFILIDFEHFIQDVRDYLGDCDGGEG